MKTIYTAEQLKSIYGQPKGIQSPINTANEQKIQQEGAKAEEFLGKSTLGQIFSKETARELLPQAGRIAKDIVVDTPIKVAKSLATAPATIATGGAYTAPGTYQSEAKKTASDIIEGKKPLISALTPFLTVPLDVTSTVGLGIGAKNALKASAPKVSEQLAKRQATKLATETNNAEKIIGQIIQGTPEDIAGAKKALTSIDVKGIKTYEDLTSTLTDRIKAVSTKLDDTLEQTPTYNNLLKIGDMDKAIKVGEQTVRNNYVDDALGQLKDFYTKTGNIERKTAIEQLIQKGNTEGLSVKELNDIAKLHGQDLSGFNASGELASGLSKQAAENTRKGLKSTAREIFGGDAYTQADTELSNLIRTRDLVDDVATKVNTLKQRVTERGFGEKVGRLVFQVADKFTGGGLKGFVQSFIPRGQGLKVMNALDLESALQKNLKAIDKALNQKTEKGMIDALNSILSEVKNTPNKQGGFIKVGQDSEAFLKSQPTKSITNKTSISKTVPKITTKNKITDIIDYIRLEKPFSKEIENEIVKLQKKYKIPEGISSTKLADRLENIVAKGLKVKGETPTTNLISEAKKYKSAEEFVKKQSIDDKILKGVTSSFKTPEDFAKNYNHKVGFSTKVELPMLEKNLLKPAVIQKGWAGDVPPRIKNLPVELELNIKDGELKLIDGYHRLNQALKEGTKSLEAKIFFHDNSKIPTKEQLVGIWNKTFATKSQLTDIWKKANKK